MRKTYCKFNALHILWNSQGDISLVNFLLQAILPVGRISKSRYNFKYGVQVHTVMGQTEKSWNELYWL